MSLNYRRIRDQDRPKQVTYAIYLLLASLATSLLIYAVRTTVNLFTNVEQYQEYRILVSVPVAAVSYVVSFYVVKKIAEGRNWARWLLFVSIGISLIDYLNGVQRLLTEDPVNGALIIGQFLATALAAFLLIQQPSRAWFKTKSSSINRESITAEKQRIIKKDVTGERKQDSELQLSADLLCQLALKPRCLVTFALSAITGVGISAIIDFLILGTSVFSVDNGFPVGLLAYHGIGAVLCVLASFVSMVVSLSLYPTAGNNSRTVEKQAELGILLGVIPGAIATAIVKIMFWGIVLV